MSFVFVAVAALVAVVVVHSCTFFIARRVGRYNVVDTKGKGEDPRYRDVLRGDYSAGTAMRKVFAVQATATWFISLPLQLSAVLGPTPSILLPVMIAGVLVWLVGLTFETVGNHQLRTFKSNPANTGVIMDRGLWAWTRHPNYFGDASVWWGLWLVTIASWLSILTVF